VGSVQEQRWNQELATVSPERQKIVLKADSVTRVPIGVTGRMGVRPALVERTLEVVGTVHGSGARNQALKGIRREEPCEHRRQVILGQKVCCVFLEPDCDTRVTVRAQIRSSAA
jgi:hypothetical protein